jgi:hypothetical protein
MTERTSEPSRLLQQRWTAHLGAVATVGLLGTSLLLVNAELSSDKPNPYTREPAVMDYLSLSTYRKELTAAREHLSQPKSSAGASAIHKTDALSSIVHYLGSQDASDRNSAFALDSTLRISYFVDTMDKLLEEANNRISTLEISSAVKRYRDYDRKHTAEVLLVAAGIGLVGLASGIGTVQNYRLLRRTR